VGDLKAHGPGKLKIKNAKLRMQKSGKWKGIHHEGREGREGREKEVNPWT
jgi:hypothetical protein